uniref:Rieske domain-containing protein n=1 Tax=Timema bartmani TaxID=61472 RepID=A0A7R9ETA9_9NEOP|nr:unnamed protein product [Timema bartmani]
MDFEAYVELKEPLQENEMREVDLDCGSQEKKKVLLVKQKGVLSALGSKCTHFGAPLATGVLGEGIVRCPWHGACFNISTGDIEDFPGIDSLPCYHVDEVGNNKLRIKASKTDIMAETRIKTMASRNPKIDNTFVILGGGPAGASCAEVLRQEGFQGRIVLVCKEKQLPYDRTMLSKTLDSKIESIQLRTQDFYDNHQIETLLGTEVTEVDFENKQVKLSTAVTLPYTKLVIATGCTPRKPNIEGLNLKNVSYLRTHDDARAIGEAINVNAKIVVVGSSFIGMEMASYCVGKVKQITVIGSVPFHRSFGKEIGAQVQRFFESKGVEFLLDTTPQSLKSVKNDGAVQQVVLKNGKVLEADAVVIGIGVLPSVDFLKGSQLLLSENDYIVVDERMQTNVKDVYAIGDAVFGPVLGTKTNIGHWQVAQYHGKVAATNMLLKPTVLHTVPFFWTRFFNMSIRYVGYINKIDDIVIHGDVAEFNFTAYYCHKGVVKAVASAGSPMFVAAAFAELTARGQRLLQGDIKDSTHRWYDVYPISGGARLV